MHPAPSRRNPARWIEPNPPSMPARKPYRSAGIAQARCVARRLAGSQLSNRTRQRSNVGQLSAQRCILFLVMNRTPLVVFVSPGCTGSEPKAPRYLSSPLPRGTKCTRHRGSKRPPTWATGSNGYREQRLVAANLRSPLYNGLHAQ